MTMTPLRAVKGMNDVLPDEIGQWHRVEAAFARTMALHRFFEVRTPYVEPTSLYVRTIGEVTDIVEKEMYSFTHHDEPLTLRPEGTAGAARAYVQHKVHNTEPVTRWYYAGPMFRAERPQRGRYRQFYQLGAEIFGDHGPACDAEMIDMLVGFLGSIGIRDVEVLVNSLGGAETRARYREALVTFLQPRTELLSETSQRRLSTNPLRILDSKSKQDQDALAGAPTIHDSFDDADRARFEDLQGHLRALGTPFRVDSNLVRGLDYYNHTIFELKGAGDKLGAGSTLVAGGRYNGMVEELGGPATPAIGFAAGLERLVIASEVAALRGAGAVFIAPLGKNAAPHALVLARELRRAGIACEADTRGGSLKNMLGRADKLGSALAVILGDDEIAANAVQVKDLAAQTQERIARDRVVEYVAARLAASTPALDGAT